MRASSIQRYKDCPASYEAEKLADPLPPSDISESGDAIHAVHAGEPKRKLTVDEEDVYDRQREQLDTLLMDYGTPDHVIQEDEFTLMMPGFELTGHPDYLAIYQEPQHAILADWKTGYLEVPPAHQNMQVRIYALLTKAARPELKTITAAIIERWGRVTITEFDNVSLTAVYQELVDIYQKTQATNPAYNPSETTCKYCPVQATCPAIKREVETMATLDVAPARWELITPDEKAELWDKLSLVQRAAAIIKSRITEEVATDPGAYSAHFREKQTSGRRTVVDPAGLAADSKLPADKFAGICSVPIGKFKQAMRDHTGMKGKALEAMVNQLVDSHAEVSAGTVSVERV